MTADDYLYAALRAIDSAIEEFDMGAPRFALREPLVAAKVAIDQAIAELGDPTPLGGREPPESSLPDACPAFSCDEPRRPADT